MLIDMELLERVESKKKALDSLRPLPKNVLEKLKKQLDIELTYNSNAIEGNTLTLQETKLILERGITIKGKKLKEHIEVVNHQDAILLLEKFVGTKENLTEKHIKEFHKLILTKINDEEAGNYRKVNVRILGAVKSPPQWIKISKLMKEFLNDFNNDKKVLHPIELAAKAHYQFVTIHPFFDGNGRTARLIMNLILMQSGYPITIILNNDRKKYYSVLKTADLGNIAPFVNFIARMVERSLSIYLNTFRKNSEFISLKDATKFCSYSQEYLSLIARKGLLDSIKLGRTWFTTKEAVQKYLQKHNTLK